MPTPARAQPEAAKSRPRTAMPRRRLRSVHAGVDVPHRDSSPGRNARGLDGPVRRPAALYLDVGGAPSPGPIHVAIDAGRRVARSTTLRVHRRARPRPAGPAEPQPDARAGVEHGDTSGGTRPGRLTEAVANCSPRGGMRRTTAARLRTARPVLRRLTQGRRAWRQVPQHLDQVPASGGARLSRAGRRAPRLPRWPRRPARARPGISRHESGGRRRDDAPRLVVEPTSGRVVHEDVGARRRGRDAARTSTTTWPRAETARASSRWTQGRPSCSSHRSRSDGSPPPRVDRPVSCVWRRCTAL